MQRHISTSEVNEAKTGLDYTCFCKCMPSIMHAEKTAGGIHSDIFRNESLTLKINTGALFSLIPSMQTVRWKVLRPLKIYKVPQKWQKPQTNPFLERYKGWQKNKVLAKSNNKLLSPQQQEKLKKTCLKAEDASSDLNHGSLWLKALPEPSWCKLLSNIGPYKNWRMGDKPLLSLA